MIFDLSDGGVYILCDAGSWLETHMCDVIFSQVWDENNLPI